MICYFEPLNAKKKNHFTYRIVWSLMNYVVFFITESIERPKYVLDENLSNFFEDKLIVSALMI